MNALIMGGERHGEWVDVLDGAQVWVDIRHAVSHRLRRLTWNVQDIRTGEIKEAYVLHVAVHEELLGPTEVQVVGQLLQMWTMNEYARAHGVKQEIEHEPSAAERLLEGKS